MSNDVTLAVLKTEFEAFREEMRAEMERNRKATADLVDAWNAAGTFIKAVKLLSTVIAAFGAIYLFVKSGWKG